MRDIGSMENYCINQYNKVDLLYHEILVVLSFGPIDIVQTCCCPTKRVVSQRLKPLLHTSTGTQTGTSGGIGTQQLFSEFWFAGRLNLPRFVLTTIFE